MNATQLLSEYRKAINPPYTFKSFVIIGLTLVLLVSVFLTVLFTFQHKAPENKPSTKQTKAPQYIPNQYIVILKEKDTEGVAIDPQTEADMAVKTLGVKILQVYKTALKGFSFSGTASIAKLLEQNPNVEYVVQDRKFQVEPKPSSLPQ